MDDLEESEIFMLLELSSSNNRFLKIIFNKIIDSIEENGETTLPPFTVIKIVTKLTKAEDIRLWGQQKEAKFMKFIERNL